MSTKRNKCLLAPISAMLTAAAMLLGSPVHGQDVAKTYQVEVPIINLLKQKLNPDNLEIDTAVSEATNQTSHQRLTPTRPSLGKRAIERPTESLLESSDRSEAIANIAKLVERNNGRRLTANAGELPLVNGASSKSLIELPTEQLIDLARPVKDFVSTHTVAPLAKPRSKPDNPSVEPGLIKWHADLTTAALQSKSSGKPVFHFQLLGQLDQRFT